MAPTDWIEGVMALAYMDDATILAEKGERPAQAVEVTNAMMMERGLEPNPKKCQWMSPPSGWNEYDELLGAHIAPNTDNPRAAEGAAPFRYSKFSDEGRGCVQFFCMSFFIPSVVVKIMTTFVSAVRSVNKAKRNIFF
jgi:hypothetical protein